MKSILLSAFLIFTQVIVAQDFAEAYPPILEDVSGGEVAFADVNGDSFSDVIVTGYSITFVPVTKLYTNDGNGNFIEVVDTPFIGVSRSSIAFSDINNDTYLDVLITGYTGLDGQASRIAKLYTNDGNGNFSEVADTPFEGVSSSSVAFSDVNGDSYSDVIITGYNYESTPVTGLFINEGNGNFSVVSATLFPKVADGSVTFSDVNGDSFPDVFISGDRDLDAPNSWIGELFINDGSGNFSPDSDMSFLDIYKASVAFLDVNNDSYPDLLLMGFNFSSTKLFTNDGVGNFTEVLNTPFAGAYQGALSFSDVNGDSYPDVLITGRINASAAVAKLYMNDGSGNFSEATDTPFTEVWNSSVAFSDINGDDHPDIVISGQYVLNSPGPVTKLYENDGSGNFSEIKTTPFTPVYIGSVAFADINGDTYPDVLVTGDTGLGGMPHGSAKLYTNDGTGHFSEVIGTPFVAVSSSEVAFADVNGDAYPDVLITGRDNEYDPVTKLYLNTEGGTFLEVVDTPFTGVRSGSISFADINSDNYPDVLITGTAESSQRIAKLYTNDGTGHFSEVADMPFTGTVYGKIALSDINGDTYPDMLVSGYEEEGTEPADRIARLYTNDGNGNFSEVPDTPFTGVSGGLIEFADVNSDSYPDVLISGSSQSTLIVTLYTNDGNGNFSEVPDTPFTGFIGGSIAFADVNGNSYPDLLITGSGQESSLFNVTKLYMNDGSGNYTEAEDIPFPAVDLSSIAFSDVDGDSYPDLLITGEARARVTKLYLNTTLINAVDEEEHYYPGPMRVKAYPNPSFNNVFYLDIHSEQSATVKLSVFDITGRMHRLESQHLTNGTNTISIDLEGYPKGMYILRLENGSYSTAIKLIHQ